MGEPKFLPRDGDLHFKWKDKNTGIPVNEQQHCFDTPERQKKFVESQLITDEERARYTWYRNEWFRRAKECDPGSFPLSVGVELVSTCNLSCSMCYTITDEFQDSVVGAHRMLPWPVVTAIIDEAAELGVPSMLFSWRGESTLYRREHEGVVYRLPDVFAYARRKGILEISMLTNGQLVDEQLAREIVEADPSWINFSIDGLRATYNKVRTPKNKRNDDSFDAFDLVCSNIERLVKIRDGLGKSRPQLRSNTIFPAIADDPKAYFEKMKSIGIGWVTVNEILDFRGSGIDGDQLPEDAIMPDWACQYPFQRLMISANGSILPCTGAHNEESALVLGRYTGSPVKSVRKKGSALNVVVDSEEMNIKEVWHSEHLNWLRETHKAGRRSEIENGCRNCRHGAKKHGVTWIPSDWNLDTMEWEGRIFRNG